MSPPATAVMLATSHTLDLCPQCETVHTLHGRTVFLCVGCREFHCRHLTIGANRDGNLCASCFAFKSGEGETVYRVDPQ